MKNIKMIGIIISIATLGMFACSNSNSVESIRPIAEEYFETYKARKDFNKFLSFYDEQIVLEDIINGDRITGKRNVKAFLNWNNSKFKLIDSVALKLDYLVVEENKAVAKGHFKPFQWGEVMVDAMHFTTILTFNEANKIVKQVDWINYPYKLVDAQNEKGSNNWIPK